MARIERKTGIALWRQIADSMRQAIVDGDHAETGMLPGEVQLAARYGVNRHTVRAAIGALVEEGLLASVQGRGTMIVRHRRYTFPIGRRTRFSEGLAGQATDREIRLVGDGVEAADAAKAEALGLDVGARLIRLDLVSLADGSALSCSRNWFRADRLEAIAAAFRQTGSVTRALERLGVPDYLRQSTELAARLADEEERRLMTLAPGAVVMVARSVNALPDGLRFQYSETAFAADRVTLRVDNLDP